MYWSLQQQAEDSEATSPSPSISNDQSTITSDASPVPSINGEEEVSSLSVEVANLHINDAASDTTSTVSSLVENDEAPSVSENVEAPSPVAENFEAPSAAENVEVPSSIAENVEAPFVAQKVKAPSSVAENDEAPSSVAENDEAHSSIPENGEATMGWRWYTEIKSQLFTPTAKN